jgi:hypothetical protein
MTAGRNIVPLIAVPAADDLGPAMQACTNGERSFVIAKVETGESNAECARLAGYSASTPDTLKSTGYAIAHRQRVQDAILEMSRKLMRSEGPKSIKTLVEIRDNKSLEAKDRLKASVELLNRAGMSAVSESHLTVTHELLTDAQKDQRILSLASELGLDEATARKMLIAPADLEKNAQIIDAEFEEVPLSDDPRNIAKRETRARRRDMTPEERKADKARIRAERSAKLKAKRAEAEAGREYAAAVAEIDPELADLF